MDFDKIKETISNEDGMKGFLTDIANALYSLVTLIGRLFKAFAIKPKYADPDDPPYAGDPTEAQGE